MNLLPKDIYHFPGRNPNGLNVLVLGGTHGNEFASIQVVDKLFDLIKEVKLIGNLYIGYGNPAAIALQTRGASQTQDLNRDMVDELIEAKPQPNDTPDLQRARELAPLLHQMDYVFDLHATSGPSEPYVCFRSNDNSKRKELLPLFPVRYVLTDPDNILAGHRGTTHTPTIDAYVDDHGGIGFCYEIGQATDLDSTDQVVATLFRLFRKIGLVDGVVSGKKYQPEVYCLKEAVQAKDELFVYQPGMDQNWIEVETGQLVGCYNGGIEERVSSKGRLVFPLAADQVRRGKVLYYLSSKLASTG